ncbi:MAG: hypothetical protein WAM61_10865 [Desulfobacterales bacterium]
MTKSSAEAEKANLKKPQGEDAQARTDSRLARLSLVALEVVFGGYSHLPRVPILEKIQTEKLGGCEEYRLTKT